MLSDLRESGAIEQDADEVLSSTATTTTTKTQRKRTWQSASSPKTGTAKRDRQTPVAAAVHPQLLQTGSGVTVTDKLLAWCHERDSFAPATGSLWPFPAELTPWPCSTFVASPVHMGSHDHLRPL